jgi:DNA-binding MarR family transcriptional regulator
MTRIPGSQAERDLRELRRLLRVVLRGLWRRGRPPAELFDGDPPLGPRHVAVLAHVAAEGSPTVGEIASDLGLTLPAASKLTGELADHSLVRRREHVDDRRRTVVELNALTSKQVEAWLAARSRPLEAALGTLSRAERDAFLKGLRALGEALMEESACGPGRSHHRPPHRRRSHRH